jgi:hypothetical protein
MIRTSVTRSFFNKSVDQVNLIFKIAKTGCLVSFPLVSGLNYSLNDFWLVLSLVAPSMYGIAMFAKHFQENRLFEKLSMNGPAAFKDASELEYAFYIIMEYLNSEDPVIHAKF